MTQMPIYIAQKYFLSVMGKFCPSGRNKCLKPFKHRNQWQIWKLVNICKKSWKCITRIVNRPKSQRTLKIGQKSIENCWNNFKMLIYRNMSKTEKWWKWLKTLKLRKKQNIQLKSGWRGGRHRRIYVKNCGRTENI